MAYFTEAEPLPLGWFALAEPPPAPYGVVSNFDFDSDRLGPPQHSAVIAIARRMMGGAVTTFRLVGHTDVIGTPQYNLELGRRRAEAVRRALVATLERMRPGSSRRFTFIVETLGSSRPLAPPNRGPAGGPNRRVEVLAPGGGGVPAPRPVPPVPVPPPQPKPTLDDVIRRCLRVLEASSMPPNQKTRLKCLLTRLLDPRAQDQYINGMSHEVRTVPGNLPMDKIPLLYSRARSEIMRPAFAPPKESDEYVQRALDSLDRQILSGIAFLNAHVETHGAAANRVLRILKDWIADRQRDQNSIYWCYGRGQ